MKHGIYFKLYKKFHNQWLCCFLTNLIYFVFCCKYLLKKITRKKFSANITKSQAQQTIDKVYPKPVSNPVYENKPINSELDLSVVIPVYNHADILEKTILSILNQKTKFSYEVIFVDDCSTDGADEILEKFQDNPKVKLIFQKNTGIGGARDTGINNACGKYLMFMDCDDIVNDNIVEILMSEAISNNRDMVMCAHDLVKETNGEVTDIIPNIYPQKNLVGYKNGDAIMNLAGLPWAKVYKRELFNNVRFFPGYWYEDTIIQTLVFTNVKSYAYIDKVGYEYKWFEKNFSHTQNAGIDAKVIDSYWLFVEIYEQYLSMHKTSDAVFYTLALRHMSAYLYPFVSKRSEEEVKALFVLAQDMVKKCKPQQKVKLPYMLQQVEKAFETNDMSLWQLASCYQ